MKLCDFPSHFPTNKILLLSFRVWYPLSSNQLYIINRLYQANVLPAANLVSFVHESPPPQIGNVQFLQLGSSPSSTSARVDLPTPVPPNITR